jgi:hypothetical protein
VRADAHDALTDTRIRECFTWLEEEVDAELRPSHASVALGEQPRTARSRPKLLERTVESIKVVESAHKVPFLCWQLSTRTSSKRETNRVISRAHTACEWGHETPLKDGTRSSILPDVRPEALLDAAETTGRICLAMEIDPRYCDVIVERWQRYTGKTARRVDDNKPVP